jgi:spermidine synthase
MAHLRSQRRLWIYPLFLLSGLGALVFEVVFLRQLTWLVGSSAMATALVLSAFMAGLALGAAWVGKLADRSPRPLRLYGRLELGAAISGAALTFLLGRGGQLFLAPLQAFESAALQRPVEFLSAFALLLVPTLFMGGTLPALGRFIIRDLGGFTGALGRLYGLNTLGAAAGAFLAGFYGFERFGVSRTGYVAAGLLTAVGLAAIALDRWEQRRLAGPARRRQPAARPGSISSAARREPCGTRRLGLQRACYLAAGVGGLSVLGYEVAWTRLLSLFMRSFSYSFSLMLALFLAGLALGAALVATAASRIRAPAAWLGWLQVAMGLYVASSLIWMPERLTPVEGSSFAGFLLSSALRAAWIVLPPTILSGMALPLAARAVATGVGRVGTDVGRVYSVNTAGAILGALFTGLILLPAVGAPAALGVLATLQALTGIVVLFAAGLPRLRLALASVLAIACAMPFLAGTERFVDAFLRASLRPETIGDLLYFHEGAVDTVAIVRREYGFRDPEAKSLITNGVAMAATVRPVWRYMALEGHLPVLFARDPKQALAIGVGTGITLGAMVSHGRLESVTGVELSEGVLGGLSHFANENGAAWKDPRVTLLHEDGRHHLELSRRRYDLITLEPPPPIVAGAVHLYTLDFYRLCQRRTNPGAVVAQWLPFHGQSLASARMIARTFVEAFPHAMLWLPSVRDAVLIGSDAPLRLDARRLGAAFASPGTRENLARAFFETPASLLSTFLLNRDGIEEWAGEAPVITDERPWMEFFRHQGGNMNDSDIASLMALPQAGWEWIDGDPAESWRAEVLAQENRALRAYVRAAVARDPSSGLEAAGAARSTEFFLYPYGCTTEQLRRVRNGSAGLDRTRAESHLLRCRRLLGATLPGRPEGDAF